MGEKRKVINREYDAFNIHKEGSIGFDADRKTDDYRMPTSLLSYDEFKELRELSEKCRKDYDGRIAKDPDYAKKKPRISNKDSAFHPLFVYLRDKQESLAGTENEDRCVICGCEYTRGNPSLSNPCCPHCSRQLAGGIVRGTDTTKGFHAYNKICIVCGLKPALPNTGGMCRGCYRAGDRLGTHDPDVIRVARAKYLNGQIVNGIKPNEKYPHFAMKKWGKTNGEKEK